MTYPGGDTVTYGYLPQLTLNSVTGSSTYVSSTRYDAAGRVEDRSLSGTALKTDDVYFPWTSQGGRLRSIQSGLAGNTTSLQNPEYAYDAVGNVDWIKGWKAGSPQTIDFGIYDGLNRLTSASATGGVGGTYTSESYTYDTYGRLSTKAGGTFTYDSTHKDAAARVIGSGGSAKTITIRARGSLCQSGWPAMVLFVNGVQIASWTVNTTTYTNYTASATLSGKDQIDIAFTNDCYVPGSEDRNLYVDYAIVDGRTVQMEGGAALRVWGATNGSYLSWSSVSTGAEALTSNGSLRFVVGQGAFVGGYDQNGNLVYRVVDGAGTILSYEAENHLTQVQTSTSTAAFVYDGDGERVKGTVAGATTAYIGNYYEWTSTSAKKYYYAGNTRVAMNDTGTVKYLLGDHLGSTSITSDAAGTRLAELRYKPWGEGRYSSGTTPTTYQFTGQRHESGLGGTEGLYFYGARWYDPLLGRFTSPDTIIPQGQGVQGWDRYGYVGNNPILYNDPTGHVRDDGCQTAGCSSTEVERKASYIQAIANEFRWQMDLVDGSEKEFASINQAGINILNKVDLLTHGKGYSWMYENLGDTTFTKGGLAGNSITFAGVIHLNRGWENSAYPLEHITHELGHIWDDNSNKGSGCPATWCGGGVADELTKFVGGNPGGFRWANEKSGIPRKNQWDPNSRGWYGNNSTTDYFAEAFSWGIYDQNLIPPTVTLWINSVIYLESR